MDFLKEEEGDVESGTDLVKNRDATARESSTCERSPCEAEEPAPMDPLSGAPLFLSPDLIYEIGLRCDIRLLPTLMLVCRSWCETLHYPSIQRRIDPLSRKIYIKAKIQDFLEELYTEAENRGEFCCYGDVSKPFKDPTLQEKREQILEWTTKLGSDTENSLTLDLFQRYYPSPWTNARKIDVSDRCSDYVDFITEDHFHPGEPVLRGMANGRRVFFSIRLMNTETQRPIILTLFERYTDAGILYIAGSSRALDAIDARCGYIHLTYFSKQLQVFREMFLTGTSRCKIHGKWRTWTW